MATSSAIEPVAITATQGLCAGNLCANGLGTDENSHDSLYRLLRSNACALQAIQLFPLPFTTVVGEITQPLPTIRTDLERYASRNARLGLAALNSHGFREQVEQCINSYDSQRVGLILGTSTSGIYDSENAYVQFVQHGRMPSDFNFIHRHAAHATAECLARELGLQGPCYAISTACSSSAKALATGQRLINAGICDAVLVGGVDTLCRLTLRGFHSLDLIAETPCAPLDTDRKGINIGEAAAFLLLQRRSSENRHHPRLLAVGESSDAHHMSAPHPTGAGVDLAMRDALNSAGLTPKQVDYINLHATATRQNDLAEAKAIHRLFGSHTPCSGVKGLIGHTLGASGAIEAIVTLLALEHDLLPGTCGNNKLDPSCPINLIRQPETGQELRVGMCNAFGFGGSNASVLMARSE